MTADAGASRIENWMRPQAGGEKRKGWELRGRLEVVEEEEGGEKEEVGDGGWGEEWRRRGGEVRAGV